LEGRLEAMPFPLPRYEDKYHSLTHHPSLHAQLTGSGKNMAFTTRPVVMGTNGMVASTHYLASQAGLWCLKCGGNAIDAGATMWFCLTILEPHRVGVAGESPILVYSADEGKVIPVNGQGPAPKAATISWFKEHGYDLIPPDGFLPAVTPAAFDAWVETLKKFGTMSLGEILQPAIELAAKGFPVYPELRKSLIEPDQEVGIAPHEGKTKATSRSTAERFLKEWPSSAKVYLPGGHAPHVGEILVNTEWARTFKEVARIESEARTSGRDAGLQAARDHFYLGPIAHKVVDFMQTFKCRDVYGREQHGLLSLEDFAAYHTRFEAPVAVKYRGYDVYKCGPWTQGPVLLQQLNLLEGFDLKKMGHNTVEYIHTLIECAKLAFADRERFYADPDYVEVPLNTLLSKEYANTRRKSVDMGHPSLELKPGETAITGRDVRRNKRHLEGDTVHLEAVDRFGNMVSATPSGAWISTSPIIPGLGFCMNSRAQMFHLDANHVERLEPGKRPSTTLSPSLVMMEEKPYMTFGTPGGDQQDQWTLQFFLNHTDFDMDIQLALDKPTVHSTHFPSSFWPHRAHPGVVHVEPEIPEEVVQGLRDKGHTVTVDPPWSHGHCLAIQYNADTGVIFGGASPRGMKAYAMGW
jgi:gamma-glutamyltranspeptidase/glutathione hydrolase